MSAVAMGLVVPILPPKEMEGPIAQTTLRLPKGMMDRIDAIAESDGYSRNEVLYHFIKWAIAEYDRERAEDSRLRASGQPQKQKK